MALLHRLWVHLVVLNPMTFLKIMKKERKVLKKIGKKVLIVGIISIFLITVLPTTKQAAVIYILPNIVNNEDLQETIKQMPELSNLGLQHLKELLSNEIKEAIEE